MFTDDKERDVEASSFAQNTMSGVQDAIPIPSEPRSSRADGMPNDHLQSWNSSQSHQLENFEKNGAGMEAFSLGSSALSADGLPMIPNNMRLPEESSSRMTGREGNMRFENSNHQDIADEEFPSDIPDSVGDFDLDRYSLIGRGSYSLVFAGCCRSTKHMVAIKAIAANAVSQAGSFAHEVKVNRALGRHRNIVELLASFSPSKGTGFLVFELCAKGEVFQQIEPGKGLMPRTNLGPYVAQLVDAVGHIHSRGVCHLDIKPENLFITEENILKIGDFGLSTLIDDGPVSGCYGSDGYSAPEMLKERDRIATNSHAGKSQCTAVFTGINGEKADIWSIGVVIFTFLFGLTPWTRAADSCYEYRTYKLSDAQPNFAPWNRMPTPIRCLIQNTLSIQPSRRWDIATLKGRIARDLGWRTT